MLRFRSLRAALALAILLTATALAAPIAEVPQPKALRPRHIVFVKQNEDPGVYVANLDGTGAHKIGGYGHPQLSWDGAKVALESKETSGRYEILDLITGEHTALPKIPEKCKYPNWSPDGAHLVFSHQLDSGETPLGIAAADGSDYHEITPRGKSAPSHYGASYAPDGKSIYAHNFTRIVQLDLLGKELRSWAMRPLLSGGRMIGDSRLAISPDGRRLLLDAWITERDPWGPDLFAGTKAIWTVDLARGKATRQTPRNNEAFYATWLDNNTILFCAESPPNEEPAIYSLALGAPFKQRKMILPEGHMPSVTHIPAAR